MSSASLSPTSSMPDTGLSEPQRLINVFIAPQSTFADLRRKASWWVPFVLSCIFAYGLVFS